MKWNLKKNEHITQGGGKGRLDNLLDESSLNPRYGGMTMRDMVRRVVLRRDDPVQEKNETDLK